MKTYRFYLVEGSSFQSVYGIHTHFLEMMPGLDKIKI